MSAPPVGARLCPGTRHRAVRGPCRVLRLRHALARPSALRDNGSAMATSAAPIDFGKRATGRAVRRRKPTVAEFCALDLVQLRRAHFFERRAELCTLEWFQHGVVAATDCILE